MGGHLTPAARLNAIIIAALCLIAITAFFMLVVGVAPGVID